MSREDIFNRTQKGKFPLEVVSGEKTNFNYSIAQAKKLREIMPQRSVSYLQLKALAENQELILHQNKEIYLQNQEIKRLLERVVK